jgi:ribose transport system ATP-binding protein
MASDADRPPLLEMRHVSKTFGVIRALNDIPLTAYAGEVHVLTGENGAGKSTLTKVLAGANLPDAGGEIRIDGEPAASVGRAPKAPASPSFIRNWRLRRTCRCSRISTSDGRRGEVR